MRHRLCENCSVYFEQEKTYCKLCGHPLARNIFSEPAKACPRCRLLHGAVSRRCASCGGALEALREAPAPLPAPSVPVPPSGGRRPAVPAGPPLPPADPPVGSAPPRTRPLLSAAWRDWKILAALAGVPLLVLTATVLVLQPGRGPTLPPGPAGAAAAAAAAERLNAEGIAAARAGRYAEAEGAFLAALNTDPESPKAPNNLGILYRRLGRIDEAIAMYSQAIALDPTNPIPHKNLGLIYEEQGRHAEAIRHFERYRTLRPDAPDADEIARKIAKLRRA